MPEEFTICIPSKEMLKKATKDGISTAFDRSRESKPCPFGASGVCCRNCSMGPCRLSLKGDEDLKRGICGATASTISARNFGRMIAAGAAAHSDHGREVAETFLALVNGIEEGYEIKDEEKLRSVAEDLGISTKDKDKSTIAKEVAKKVLFEFGRQDGELAFITRAPKRRQDLWRKHDLVPRGIDREIVEMMHRTSIGVDQDYRSILHQGSRCALADGYGGSMISTELQDIMFGLPIPIRGKVNLGVLKEDEVNVLLHGHEPLLAEMIVAASSKKELLDLAEKNGANGINIAGICCTANEVLMRHGIPLAGNFLQQELAIITGAVEAMVVDVQCIMQSLPSVARCYHTEIITTSKKAIIPDATHIEFNTKNAPTLAEEILYRAVNNFKNRNKERVNIPKSEMDLVAGFSHETIKYILGGRYRASYRPLNDNIINGRIRGVVGVVGCNNPRVVHDACHVALVKELIKADILVLQTGCSAIASAKAGLMIPEAASLAGPGLREVCEAVGIPPVLHCGSCVDNSRLLVICANMVKEGGLGDDYSDLPVAGCAPEWMSEKAIAIGQYFVASGIFVIFGVGLPVTGSEITSNYLFNEYERITGGRWAFEEDPIEMARLIIEHIDKKRAALGIDRPKERVLYDMEMRRELRF